MSNTTRIDRIVRGAGAALFVVLAACADEPAGAAQEQVEPTQATAPRPTGTPAQRLSNSTDIADESRIISMKDIEQGDEPACRITFAYEGYAPETLIWSKEPCGEVSAMFLTRAELEHHNDWQKLSDYDRTRFATLPDGEVLYVGGEFTASVYPIDYNNLTYEVTVSD